MTDRPRSRGWLWFFLFVAVMTVAATATLAVFNLRQQLTPGQLDAAQKAWKEHGPADYVFAYTIKREDAAGGSSDHFLVTVRGGRATETLVNGLPVEPARLSYYGMPKLFEYVERFLELDAEPGKRKTFTRAIFNPNSGALLWYVRRVMGSRERVEISVETFEAK